MEPAGADGTSAATNRSSRRNKTLYGLPVHCLTERDLAAENGRQVLAAFHRPTNAHDRFMASLTQQSRSILRDIQRPEEFTSSSSRPASAAAAAAGASSRPAARPAASSRPASRPATAPPAAAAVQAALSATTAKGVPCYSMEAVLCADVVAGRPANTPGGGSAAVKLSQQWRLARVKAYAVPPSRYGHGEAGARAFHQTYAFYKKYGFAGRGAATSWASSPTKHAHAQQSTVGSSSTRGGGYSGQQQRQHVSAPALSSNGGSSCRRGRGGCTASSAVGATQQQQAVAEGSDDE